MQICKVILFTLCFMIQTVFAAETDFSENKLFKENPGELKVLIVTPEGDLSKSSVWNIVSGELRRARIKPTEVNKNLRNDELYLRVEIRGRFSRNKNGVYETLFSFNRLTKKYGIIYVDIQTTFGFANTESVKNAVRGMTNLMVDIFLEENI